MKTKEELENVFQTGCDPKEARFGFIMLHGRGSDANDMKSVLPNLLVNDAYILMPQAPIEIMPGRFAWYPYFWNENLEENMRALIKAYEVLDNCVEHMNDVGISDNKIVFIAHSQGANLMLEYYLSNPRNYKALISMRGCVLGNFDEERDFNNKLPNTLVVLNAGRRDPYIPIRKIEQSCATLKRLGANVHKHQYESGHGICRPELMDLRRMIRDNFSHDIDDN